MAVNLCVGVPDLKVNARVSASRCGTQIGSRGVVALLNNGGPLFLIRKLASSQQVPQVPGRPPPRRRRISVVVSTNTYGRLDVKSGQRTTFDTANAPAAAT